MEDKKFNLKFEIITKILAKTVIIIAIFNTNKEIVLFIFLVTLIVGHIFLKKLLFKCFGAGLKATLFVCMVVRTCFKTSFFFEKNQKLHVVSG